MVIKINWINNIKCWCLWREEHRRSWRKPSEKVRDKLNSTHKTDSQTSNAYLNRWMICSSTLVQPPVHSTIPALSTLISYLLWGNMAKQRHLFLDRSCNRMLASTHNLQFWFNSDQIRHTDNLSWRPLTQVIMTTQWIEVEIILCENFHRNHCILSTKPLGCCRCFKTMKRIALLNFLVTKMLVGGVCWWHTCKCTIFLHIEWLLSPSEPILWT